MADEHEDEPAEVEGINRGVGGLGTVGLISKPKTSSTVWNYFGIKNDSLGNPLVGELEKPVCKLCKKSVLAKGSNTSNLLSISRAATQKHIRKRVQQLVKKMKHPTIEETIDRNKPYNANSSQAQELNRAVASFYH